MVEDGIDTCPICLECLDQTGGVLQLACTHKYHAVCLLECFLGETASHYRCPCCRAPVATAFKPSKRPPKQPLPAATSLPDSEYPNSRPHTYLLQQSRYGTVQAFLAAAACAASERMGDPHPCRCPMPSTSAAAQSSADTRFCRGPWARCMGVLERVFPPTADSFTAVESHLKVQRLLNPSLPHPGRRALNYAVAMLLSTVTAVLCVVLLRAVMVAAGNGVCAVVDAAQSAAGDSVAWDGSCVAMVPDGWFLPLGFAGVGLYIALQISWLMGVTVRHVALSWDTRWMTALGAWMAATMGYTAFAYGARLLLTLVVGFFGANYNNPSLHRRHLCTLDMGYDPC